MYMFVYNRGMTEDNRKNKKLKTKKTKTKGDSRKAIASEGSGISVGGVKGSGGVSDTKLSKKPLELASKTLDVLETIKEIFEPVTETKDLRRKYNDNHKLITLALFAQGKSYREIMEITGVPTKATIHNWIHGAAEYEVELAKIGHSELIERTKNELSNRSYLMANRILSSVDDSDLDKATLLQKTTAYCQMVDKGRLTENKSTDNISLIYGNRDLTDSVIDTTEKELQDLQRQRDSL